MFARVTVVWELDDMQSVCDLCHDLKKYGLMMGLPYSKIEYKDFPTTVEAVKDMD